MIIANNMLIYKCIHILSNTVISLIFSGLLVILLQLPVIYHNCSSNKLYSCYILSKQPKMIKFVAKPPNIY